MALHNLNLFQPKPTAQELENTISSLMDLKGDKDKISHFINQSVRNSQIGDITAAISPIESEKEGVTHSINELVKSAGIRLRITSTDEVHSKLAKLATCLDKNSAYIPFVYVYGINEVDAEFFRKSAAQFLKLFKKLDLLTQTINHARTALHDVNGQVAVPKSPT